MTCKTSLFILVGLLVVVNGASKTLELPGQTPNFDDPEGHGECSNPLAILKGVNLLSSPQVHSSEEVCAMYHGKNSCCGEDALIDIEENFWDLNSKIVGQLNSELVQLTGLLNEYNDIEWPQRIKDDPDTLDLIQKVVKFGLRDVRQYLRSFNVAMCRCLKEHFNKFVSESCALCNPDWQSFVSLDPNGGVVVQLQEGFCDSSAAQCRPVINDRAIMSNEFLLATSEVIAYLTASGQGENLSEDEIRGKSADEQIRDHIDQSEQLQAQIKALKQLRDDLLEASSLSDFEEILYRDVFSGENWERVQETLGDDMDFVISKYASKLQDHELTQMIQQIREDYPNASKEEVYKMVLAKLSAWAVERTDYDVSFNVEDEVMEILNDQQAVEIVRDILESDESLTPEELNERIMTALNEYYSHSVEYVMNKNRVIKVIRETIHEYPEASTEELVARVRAAIRERYADNMYFDLFEVVAEIRYPKDPVTAFHFLRDPNL